MNEVMIKNVQRSEDQSETPEGFIAYIGLDYLTSEETGVLNVVEFIVPNSVAQVFIDTLEWEQTIVVLFTRSFSQEVKMHGVAYIWTHLLPVGIGSVE